MRISRMIDAGDMRYLFIINPRAGRRHMTDLVDRIESALSNTILQGKYAIMLTDRRGHAMELASAFADKYGSRGLVIACGGDGTAGEVAQAICKTETAMTILPIGTANDFSKVIYKDKSIESILSGLTDTVIESIDLIKVDDKICLNITSLGFDTKVQIKFGQLTRKYRRLGTLAYPLAIILSLLGSREYKMRYQINIKHPDGSIGKENGHGSYILAAICNGRYYGGGFNPAPDALINDGILNLCLVDNISLLRVLGLIGKYKKGLHLGDLAFHMFKTVSGRVESEPGTLLLGNIDGEPFEKESIDFEVMPGALRFAMPAQQNSIKKD